MNRADPLTCFTAYLESTSITLDGHFVADKKFAQNQTKDTKGMKKTA